jgi:predicted phage tail protein
MELVYVTVIGAAIGTLLRYVLPGRETYGIVLLPALGAAVTAAVWVSLVWLGFTFDGGWIWAISLGAATVVSAGVALALARARSAADLRQLHVLAGGKP